MRKVIIVEGKQDAAFVKALAPDVEVREIEIQELGGLGKDNIKPLKIALNRVKNDALLNPVEKIGILLDLDPVDFNEESKLAFLNEALQEVFGVALTEVNGFQSIVELDTQVACHFISPNLDILLKKIAAQPSPRADCLHSCLEGHANAKQKEIDKAWPLYYMRWDICEFEERENGSKYVNFTHTHTKGAWNLNATVLEEVKAFLALF